MYLLGMNSSEKPLLLQPNQKYIRFITWAKPNAYRFTSPEHQPNYYSYYVPLARS